MTPIRLRDFYVLFFILLIRGVDVCRSRRLHEIVVGSIGFAGYRLSRKVRQIRDAGVTLAFGPTLAPREKDAILFATFLSSARATFSLFAGQVQRRMIQGTQITGIEQLNTALENGTGVILWETNSFGYRDTAKQLLSSLGFSIHQVHGEHHFASILHHGGRQSWFRRRIINSIFQRWTERTIAQIISLARNDPSLRFTRVLADLLRNNAVVCIAADGTMGQKYVRLEFLGTTRRFATGTVSLSRISHAPLHPIFCFHQQDGTMRCMIERPIEFDTCLDRESQLEQGVRQYVRLFETYIRQHPGQYRGWRPDSELTEANEVPEVCTNSPLKKQKTE